MSALPPAMNPTHPRLLDWLQRSLRFARGLSDDDGRMRDPYETEYGENFAPACFCVIAAAAWRLERRPEDRAWALRWGRRSAAIMRESPYLREYMLGYVALVFTLLEADAAVEHLRAEIVAASQPDEALSPLGHILALQLAGDVLCPRHAGSPARAERILTELEALLTPAGFAEDRREGDDGSIPHAYLTVACLVIFLLARPGPPAAQRLQPRLEAYLARTCAWFARANGPAMTAVQANRSYNQLWVQPLHALLAFVHRGDRAGAVVARCLATVDRATEGLARPNFLPTGLSPYASAGNEPYNRVNNDVGAGGVAWALLALLQAAGFKGLAANEPAPEATFADAAAGYAFCHGERSGAALVLRQHRWHYHLPLQPAWLVVGGSEAPFIGAKRAGVNHPLAALIGEPARINPWLEPYFGVAGVTKEGIHLRMGEPVRAVAEGGYAAALRAAGGTNGGAEVAVRVVAEADAVVFDYRITGEPTGELWVSVPVLLWDGRNELGYRVAGARVELTWDGRRFALVADAGGEALAQPWILRRERFGQTGFGLTGNFALALGSVRRVRIRCAALSS